MADAALGGMPGWYWLRTPVPGRPLSSHPLSLIGDGSRRFCTMLQSVMLVMGVCSNDRGTERSTGGGPKPVDCMTFPAAPLQLPPRTWAANEQCMGVGSLLVMLPGCIGSG